MVWIVPNHLHVDPNIPQLLIGFKAFNKPPVKLPFHPSVKRKRYSRIYLWSTGKPLKLVDSPNFCPIQRWLKQFNGPEGNNNNANENEKRTHDTKIDADPYPIPVILRRPLSKADYFWTKPSFSSVFFLVIYITAHRRVPTCPLLTHQSPTDNYSVITNH